VDPLGSLIKVEIGEVWPDEARDFTPWLARPENLAILSEELGLDISLLSAEIKTEASVGKFRVDILAKESTSGDKIIIENQTKETDHDHLGKLITYAAGHNAKYLVWIVKNVREEHKRAVAWLNENLGEDICVFLVKIEIWQIGTSDRAPKFEIISERNNWASTVKKETSDAALTETRLKQLDFWEQFSEYAKSKDSGVNPHKPSPQGWTDLSIGTSLCYVALSTNSQKNRLTCDLYIPRNKLLCELLKEREIEICELIDPYIEWFEASVASGFRIPHEVEDVFDESKYQNYFDWYLENAKKIKETIIPMIEDFQNL